MSDLSIKDQAASVIGKDKPNFFRACAADFKKIPGSPIAYWVSANTTLSFEVNKKIRDYSPGKFGMSTADTSVIHYWHEVPCPRILFTASKSIEFMEPTPFSPYDKGGEYRRWYGNRFHVINWHNDGEQIRSNPKSAVRNAKCFCQPHISWTLVTSGKFSCRYFERGFLLDTASNAIYESNAIELNYLLAILNSRYMRHIAPIINPTMNFSCGVIDNVPVASVSVVSKTRAVNLAAACTTLAKTDWDSYETSWDFTRQPLLNDNDCQCPINDGWHKLSARWQEMTQEMQTLEKENNRIFIEAYGLQDELTPEVPLEEITLTCNPVYRYGPGKTDEEYEQLQRADTMKELISYAVGCMMGRYSPDTPGLQFAGGTYDHDKACAAAPSFHPDADGILPVLAEAYFEDDLTARFTEFLKATFGKEHLSENLRFVAEAIGIKGSESPQDAIRRFLANDFFKYHMKMYKKRPIYWLFSSGKEKAFQALVYLHRYTPSTLARMRTGYLHELQNKLRARIEDMEAGKDAATSTAQANRINRELTKLRKQLEELRVFDEKLHHYADQRIELDLDDGVKHNYGLFGDLLAEVKDVTGDKE